MRQLRVWVKDSVDKCIISYRTAGFSNFIAITLLHAFDLNPLAFAAALRPFSACHDPFLVCSLFLSSFLSCVSVPAFCPLFLPSCVVQSVRARRAAGLLPRRRERWPSPRSLAASASASVWPSHRESRTGRVSSVASAIPTARAADRAEMDRPQSGKRTNVTKANACTPTDPIHSSAAAAWGSVFADPATSPSAHPPLPLLRSHYL